LGERPIRVLTIEREYGSGAADIARTIAERLGWKLWDPLLTTEIARHLECDKLHVERHEETRDPLYYRLFKAFLRGSFEGSINAHRMKLADAETIRCVAEKLVREAGEEGNCVIVGRGSAYYLHGSPDVFNVFVYAPFAEKVRRLQQAGHSEQEAIQLAETVDQDRSAFIKDNFGIEWPSRPYFHLMINSAMGDEAAVQTILDAMKAFRKVLIP
jgi:cytidylate kinase